MTSSNRQGGGRLGTPQVTSQTQANEAWLEAAFEQEAAWRQQARMRATMNQQGTPSTGLGQQRQEDSTSQQVPQTPTQHHSPSKGTTVMAIPAPQVQVTVSVGKAMTQAERKIELARLVHARTIADQERKLESERITRMRQQRINFYRRPKAETMPMEERKAARERLYKTPAHQERRDKSPTGLGHMLLNGETAPPFARSRRYLRSSKSQGGQPSMRTGQQFQRSGQPSQRGGQSFQRAGQTFQRSMQPSRRAGQPSQRSGLPLQRSGQPSQRSGQPSQRASGGQQAHRDTSPSRRPDSAPAASGEEEKVPFEGLTIKDYLKTDWRPSFNYRPAKQDKPWENLEGFSQSTRSLERRKMDPFLDIQSFTAAGQVGYVRPLDVKGQLGARSIQQWKNTLREDFAQDMDNFSSNA